MEAVRAGVIGEVGEVYCHNSGPKMGGGHFANPKTLPLPESPIPEGLSWDNWLGPAAMRPFYRDYLPYKWRAFYDFGLGMLGDWGCHTFDTPVWALDLDPPTVVSTRKGSVQVRGRGQSTQSNKNILTWARG